MKPYRSILFVPGNRPDWIDKAPRFGPDALIIDLEDAVPIAEKQATRSIVSEGTQRSFKRGMPIVVRVNGLATGLTSADVEAIVSPGVVAIAVPKLEAAEELLKVDAWIELCERKAGLPVGGIEIMALPETARGIMKAYELATACARVGSVIGGVGSRSGDVAQAIGYKWTRPGLETLYMASHVLMANRAAGFAYPVGTGSLEVGDLDLVRSQLERTRQIGYRGALLIHPAAVPIANEVFAPSREEIEWNKGVLRAMARAEEEGRAATTYDGMMIDYAHVRNALDLLQQAAAFGMEVGDYPHVQAL